MAFCILYDFNSSHASKIIDSIFKTSISQTILVFSRLPAKPWKFEFRPTQFGSLCCFIMPHILATKTLGTMSLCSQRNTNIKHHSEICNTQIGHWPELDIHCGPQGKIIALKSTEER